MEEVVDPVCGATIEREEAVDSATYDGIVYYFCSERCRDAFEVEPQRYAE